MESRRARVAASVLFCFCGLFLLACGGGSEAVERRDERPISEPDPASPMERYLGFASDPGRRQYQLITRQRAADEAMTQCMDGAGFFYATVPAEDALRSGPFVGDGSREWTERNGLGIASALAEALALDAQRGIRDAEQANQANMEFVGLLTNEQAIAYDQALVGDLTAPSGDAGYQPGGCWGSSYGEIVRVLGLVNEFTPELELLNSRVGNDPRMVGFQQSWSACMESSGYRYSDQQAMVDDIYARVLDIGIVETSLGARVADPEALDALATFERQVAVAGFDCASEFEADLAKLRYDYEQEFIQDFRGRLAELGVGPDA